MGLSGEKILKTYEQMSLVSSFRFGCHEEIPCFNKCCGDVNIFLTPYDVLRMKNRLKMESEEFLEKYTQIPIEKSHKFPIVKLKMGKSDGLPCLLVTEEGCSIYEDRPWPCRMYPLGMAMPKDHDSGKEFYFLMKEEVCEGFGEPSEWTVLRWFENQEIEKYNEFGRLFKEITLHEHFSEGKALTPEKMEMFYMACYDLDRFRQFVFKSTFLKRFDVREKVLTAIQDNDEALLKFASRWLKFCLYGKKTMKIRPEATT